MVHSTQSVNSSAAMLLSALQRKEGEALVHALRPCLDVLNDYYSYLLINLCLFRYAENLSVMRWSTRQFQHARFISQTIDGACAKCLLENYQLDHQLLNQTPDCDSRALWVLALWVS